MSLTAETLTYLLSAAVTTVPQRTQRTPTRFLTPPRSVQSHHLTVTKYSNPPHQQLVYQLHDVLYKEQISEATESI